MKRVLVHWRMHGHCLGACRHTLHFEQLDAKVVLECKIAVRGLVIPLQGETHIPNRCVRLKRCGVEQEGKTS